VASERCNAQTESKVRHTTGEFFADGTAIDVIHRESGEFALLYWDGEKSRTAPQIEIRGLLYKPATLDASIAQRLRVPGLRAPYGNSKQLLDEISNLFVTYLQLPSTSVALATAFSVGSWFAPTQETTPWLSIVARDFERARRLMRLLGCFCRRALLLTDFTMTGICSLPLDWGFTMEISQNPPSRDLFRLLNVAHERGGCIIQNGRLIRPFAPIVTCSGSALNSEALAVAPIEIATPPCDAVLPALQVEAEHRIAGEFQPKLLAYMLDNYRDAKNRAADDLAILPGPLRETGRSLTACLPRESEFLAETLTALKMQLVGTRCDRSTEIEAVLIESLLFHVHNGSKGSVYVGQLARNAELILAARGENLKLAPKNVAARLRDLGLITELRDQRGFRYLLTRGFGQRVHELAHAMDIPTILDGRPRCMLCEAFTANDGYGSVSAASSVRNVPNEGVDVITASGISESKDL
jgi:hypothetical protein